MTVRKTRQTIKNWLLVFFWAGFIFFLSHQPDLSSGLSRNWDFLLSNLAHFLEYAVLTFLLIEALRGHQSVRRIILILAVVLAVGYAFSDEYHQSFVFGRQASGQDILIDSLGVFLTVWLAKRKVMK